jgi:diguanylate cyclase (GGDEF)-like protein
MPLWSRRRRQAKEVDSQEASVATAEELNGPGSYGSPDDDRARDVLAETIKTLGAFGFDTATREAERFERQCQRWAAHLLTGAAPPIGTADLGPVTESQGEPARRQRRVTRWADLLQFLRLNRRDEQQHVLSTEEGMRTIILELAANLRRAVRDDAQLDQVVSREMNSLNEVVQRNSLADIRTQMARTMRVVTDSISQREQRYQDQLQSMSQHVSELRTDLLLARKKLETDALTQLYNRGAFDAFLAKQVDLCFLTAQPLALLMIDIDHFKKFNDTYGHPGGDAALRAFADVIVRAFPRRNDFVARYGGEEFATVLVDANPDDLPQVCERLLRTVRKLRVPWKDEELQLTCSVGASTYQRGEAVEEFLKRADDALYRAKGEGRNRARMA